VVGFTGRADQLAQLDSMVPDHAGPAGTALAISALAGAAGVGKTALAIHWAHRVAPSFPDGQLYVDLRGYAPVPPMPPIEALSRFLRALGVPAEQVPSDVDEAAAMYRSLLTGKRILVLLDNAYDPDQIRPLLPAPGCLTLITSRDRLAGLIARDGATAIVVDVLSDDEAADLLLRLLGRDRVRAEPGAVKELAGLCGYLPLALRIAAANLITNSYPSIGTYVTCLAGDRLDNLEVDGDPRTGIRAAFDLSYATLAPAARCLFRRMGFLPGQDLAAGGAAAMLGVEPVAAGRLLSRLTTAHLAQESRSGRFALYTLVRDYAGEKAAAEESKDERQAALGRLYDYYLRHVDGAGRQLYPEMLRLPPAVPVPARFKDKADAWEWLDAERSNLVATVVHCATHGPQHVAWQLADGLRGYFQRRMLAAEWHEVAKAGIAAAEAAGDAFALTASHLNLAALHATTGNKEEAINGYHRTVELAEDAGWPEARAAAVSNIGGAYLSLGRFEQAAVYLSRSLAMRRRIGWPIGEATDLDNLGLAYWGQGRLELAAEHHARAADIYRRLDASLAEAKAHGALAVAYHSLGQLGAARDLLTESLETLREAGDRYSFGHASYCLADVHRDLGNYEAAMGLAEAALTAAAETGHPSLESSALATLASLHHQLGETRKAIDGHRLALERARAAGDLYRQADSMVRLAASCHGTEPGAAKDVAQQALDLSRAEGYRLLEGQALTVLAATQLACGEAETAAETAEQALDRHASTGYRLGRARAHLVAGHAWKRLGEGGRAKAHLANAQAAFDELAIDSAAHIRMLTSR
jgi:tetratricopeptide (TPR) repeat protein